MIALCPYTIVPSHVPSHGTSPPVRLVAWLINRIYRHPKTSYSWLFYVSYIRVKYMWNSPTHVSTILTLYPSSLFPKALIYYQELITISLHIRIMLTLSPWFSSYPISTYGTSPVRTIPSNLRFVAQKPHIFTKSETPPISIHIFPLVYAWFIFPLGIWINHHILSSYPWWMMFPSYSHHIKHLRIIFSSSHCEKSKSSHLHIFQFFQFFPSPHLLIFPSYQTSSSNSSHPGVVSGAPVPKFEAGQRELHDPHGGARQKRRDGLGRETLGWKMVFELVKSKRPAGKNINWCNSIRW